MKQMGWLHATPREPSRKGKTPERATRLDKILAKGGQPALPPVVFGTDVLGMFLDVGPAASGAAGATPISYTEIAAWARVTGYDLRPWQGQLLRHLSRVYVGAVHTGEDPDAAPPYVDIQQARRAEVSARIATVFGALAKKGLQK